MNPRPYKFIANIRFLDTDKYGHVNNSVYFTYFEEARTEWVFNFKELISWAEENSIQFVLAEQSCKYLLPLFHPNKIEITQHISKIGAASMEFDYEIRVLGNDNVVTKAKAKLACYNSKTSRLQKFPHELKQMILEKND